METHVPVSLLIPSPGNARRTNRLVDIDVLAALIKSQGLLQNLVVRDNGHGKYEVVDGLRRLAALKSLIKTGDWPRARPVAINVLSAEHNDTEVSLAANLGRVDMHPADTFEAFRLIAETEGASPETIGMRFGYAATTVRGFLKLANVSPKLMKAFRKDEISLDQMKALAITDDHGRQEEVFFTAPDYLRSPRDLRRLLMEGRIGSGDKLARFVGLDAYEAAGGPVTRDLFAGVSSGDGDDEEDNGGVYLEDSGLLHRLATAKLEAEAVLLREQGWKWVEIDVDLTESGHHRLARVSPQSHGFEPDSETARLYAGIILGVDRDGRLKALTGLLKPEDARALKRAGAGEKAGGTKDEGSTSAPMAPANIESGQMSAALVEELTAQKTAALQALLATRPDLALAVVVHDLALPLFYQPWENHRRLTELVPRVIDAKPLLADGEASKAVADLAAATKHWQECLPEEARDLWPWLIGRDQSVLLELMGVVFARNVDAIHYRHEKRVPERVASGNRLAQSLALDMRHYWRADATFLSRLSKAAILGVISEACSPEIAGALDRAGKAELVAVAERRLAGGGWLPVVLRAGGADSASPETGGIEEEDDDIDPEQHMERRNAAE